MKNLLIRISAIAIIFFTAIQSHAQKKGIVGTKLPPSKTEEIKVNKYKGAENVLYSPYAVSLWCDKHSVQIGKQVWLDANLNVDHFRNGDSIPQAKTNQEWYEAGKNEQPAWCYFDNKASYGKKYGKLYNWYAVNDKRGLAPEGWHVPSNMEWDTLAKFLGGDCKTDITCWRHFAGKKMKSTTGWTIGAGTNESGFNALPASKRGWGNNISEYCFFDWYSLGGYQKNNPDEKCFFWSTTQNDMTGFPWCVSLSGASYRDPDALDFGYITHGMGYSVRCVKDSE